MNADKVDCLNFGTELTNVLLLSVSKLCILPDRYPYGLESELLRRSYASLDDGSNF